MNVQSTLDLIEEVLENGSSIPFSSKTAVDVDAIRTYIKDIRLDLPVEIEKAQEIVDHYNSIVKKASTEASVATSTAQKQSEEIIGAAKERAKGIIDNAEANAKSTIAAATEQARRMVEATEVAHLAQVQQAAPECVVEAEKLLPSHYAAIALAAQHHLQGEKEIPHHSPDIGHGAAVKLVGLPLLNNPLLAGGAS